MLFGSNRDYDLLVNINRELLKDIARELDIALSTNIMMGAVTCEKLSASLCKTIGDNRFNNYP